MVRIICFMFTDIVLALLGIFPMIICIIVGIIGLGLFSFYLYYHKKPSSACETANPTNHRPAIERFKFLRQNWIPILICVACVLGLLWQYLWQHNYFPLKYQPKPFYVHSDEAVTYPKLGLVISLQSVKTFGTKDEIGAKGFKLVSYGQPAIVKESIVPGDSWDFQVDGIQYRLVFIGFVDRYGTSAKLELSQLSKKKD